MRSLLEFYGSLQKNARVVWKSVFREKFTCLEYKRLNFHRSNLTPLKRNFFLEMDLHQTLVEVVANKNLLNGKKGQFFPVS